MIQKEDGFVMLHVLVFIMMILLFLTSWFSASVFRYKTALMRIQKEEARYAAEVVLQLIENDIEVGNVEWIQDGLEKTETTLEFEPNDGTANLNIPVTVWTEYKGEELYLFVEAEVGQKKERVSSVLELFQENGVMTDSNAEIVTPSNAV